MLYFKLYPSSLTGFQMISQEKGRTRACSNRQTFQMKPPGTILIETSH